MYSRALTQPTKQLGEYLGEIIREDDQFRRIVFVSAFVGLRTVLRLKDRLLQVKDLGCELVFNVGIDLGGTSKQVLEELLRWECGVFITHNPAPRATFHPKIYLIESEKSARVIIGSNNLTDGGLYTNHEAATCHTFKLPDERDPYEEFIAPLEDYLWPAGSQVQPLTDELISILHSRGQLLTEREARSRIVHAARPCVPPSPNAPDNPFPASSPKLPPLLPREVRRNDLPTGEASPDEQGTAELGPVPEGVLVWRKRDLRRTDAQQTDPGTHPVGGVRLTQAGFERPQGERIDQTTYFRTLFQDFGWQPEPGRHADQEHTFVPMRVVLRGADYGIRNFEITHKPSGEAGQGNYTTQLRWGRDFTPTIVELNLTGRTLSLYETRDANSPFVLVVE